MNELDGLTGIRVVVSHYMQDFNIKQVKQLNYKRWMNGKCYCRRVNKKWLKRYGETRERLFMTDGSVIITSPANASFIKAQYDAQTDSLYIKKEDGNNQ